MKMKKKALRVVIPMLALALVLAAPAAAQGGGKGYLIGSAAPLTEAQVAQLGEAGASVVHVYVNFGGASAVISPQNVERVRALPFVTSVNEDTVRQLDAVEVSGTLEHGAALPGTPYWHDLINLEGAGGFDGSGVWVAVLDSGFYPNWRDYFDESDILTDLASAFVAANANQNNNQWDVGSDPHAMAVSGTIVGYRLADDTNEGGWGEGFATGAAGTYWVPGIAPGAKIIPIRVCEPIGCFGSAINAAMDYVTSLKLANPGQPIVINESLGGPRLDATEKAAIDAAVSAGVVIVASAGNSGDQGMGFPGAYEPVISTGAGGWVDQWNEYPDKTWWLDDVPDGRRTEIEQVFVVDFSSRQLAGQYLDVVSTGRHMLLPYPCAQLYHDGQVISSTNVRTCASKATPDNASAAPFQYLFISGTSFSAPTVSAIVALMLDKDPSLSNADATFGTLNNPASWGPGSLEVILEDSATDIPAGIVTTTFRTGVLDVECWELGPQPGAPNCTTNEATGFGWVFVDDALAAIR